jgi:hypothetical protein
VAIIAMVLSVYQNNKYAEFVSQFEFESDTVYQRTNDNSDINGDVRIIK